VARRPLLTARTAAPWLALGALPLVGRGWQNGDAAAYCAQAWSGDLTDRWTHVGYVFGAWLLSPLGPGLPLALDMVGVAAAVVAAAAAARLAGNRPVAAVAAVAALLPIAPFLEVDPVWIALVVASAAGMPGAMALAVAVSPTALLALPWVGGTRGRGPWGEAVVAIAVLTVVSSGAWWMGERGVLVAPPPRPVRMLWACLAGVSWPLLIAALARRRDARSLVLLAPLVLAPPDVPVWALAGVACGVVLGRAPAHAAVPWLVAVALVLGGARAVHRAGVVAAEHAVVTQVVASWRVGDGMEAPFTWGARVSVAATGHPYGLPWHPPGGWLRDQRRQWCVSPPTRVVHLPPASAGVRWDSPRIGQRQCPAPAER